MNWLFCNSVTLLQKRQHNFARSASDIEVREYAYPLRESALLATYCNRFNTSFPDNFHCCPGMTAWVAECEVISRRGPP